MRALLLRNHPYYAIVDDVDFEWASRRAWHLGERGYVVGTYTRKGERSRLLHRVMLAPPDGVPVDHINGNPLDNRRANLRLTTGTLNQANAKKRARASSRYKGVHWNRKEERWIAVIVHEGRFRCIGRFRDEREAALAYDRAARETFGEFARPNF